MGKRNVDPAELEALLRKSDERRRGDAEQRRDDGRPRVVAPLDMPCGPTVMQRIVHANAQRGRAETRLGTLAAKAENARAGRAEKGAKVARAEKAKQRATPEAQAAERRRDADIRYLIREDDSDRTIAGKMRDRAEKLDLPHLKVGRGKIAEIRRSMRRGGPA